MTPRYAVTEVDGFIGGDRLLVRVFTVTKTNGRQVNGRPEDPAQVWVKGNGIKTNCTTCSGALNAMLSSCRHCEAVKRFLKKGKS